MFKTKYNIEYFIICSPLKFFLVIKLILRPAQQFEFDMPVWDKRSFNFQKSKMLKEEIFKKWPTRCLILLTLVAKLKSSEGAQILVLPRLDDFKTVLNLNLANIPYPCQG